MIKEKSLDPILDNTPIKPMDMASLNNDVNVEESLASKLDTIKGIFSNEPTKQVSASEEVEQERVAFQKMELN